MRTSSDFSQGIEALKLARLVCLPKKIVVIIITTGHEVSRRTPIANNHRHVTVCIVQYLRKRVALATLGLSIRKCAFKDRINRVRFSYLKVCEQ